MTTARQTPCLKGTLPCLKGGLQLKHREQKRTFDERGPGPPYGGLSGHGAVGMVQPKGSAAARADCSYDPQRPSYPHTALDDDDDDPDDT